MAGSLKDQLLRAGLTASEPKEPPPQEATAAPEDAVRFAAKVVARYSRKGSGGRDVTRITGVVAGREEVLARLVRELGTGGRIEGEELVIQGEQVERVARWLESRGAPRVVRT